MKNIKLPSTSVLIVGSLGAFWLADMVNPGFNPIGVMILLLIPILIFELLYPESEIDKLFEPGKPIPAEESTIEDSIIENEISGELLPED